MKNAVYAAVCTISLLATTGSAQIPWWVGREGHMMALGHDWASETPQPAAKPTEKKPKTSTEWNIENSWAGLGLFATIFGADETKKINQSVSDTLNAKYAQAVRASASSQSEEALAKQQSAEIDQLVEAKNFDGVINNILNSVYKSDKVLIYAIDAAKKAKGPAHKVSSAVLKKVKNGPANEYAEQHYKKWLLKNSVHPKMRYRYWERP
jgi:hypothetical protein